MPATGDNTWAWHPRAPPKRRTFRPTTEDSQTMMTAYRFHLLKAGASPSGEEETQEYLHMFAWERRSAAAKRAVATKRQRYYTWPTRKGDHRCQD